MSTLTEQTTIEEKNFFGPYNILHIAWVTRIYKNGEVISASDKTRTTFHPGSDISSLPQSVQDAAAALWTQDVIDAYNAAQQATE